VVRIVRRHYRLDIPAAPCYSMAKEVEDVLALAKVLGEPMVIVGHSSGAVVALEALVAAPSAFAGAVLFEPPVATGPEPGDGALERAKAAIAAGKPGTAMQIFVCDAVGMPASQAWLMRPLTAVIPKMRSLARRDHSAHLKAADEVARVIETLAGKVLP
jgi:pimeloyl-ACP methyl ester carboxylesterase